MGLILRLFFELSVPLQNSFYLGFLRTKRQLPLYVNINFQPVNATDFFALS